MDGHQRTLGSALALLLGAAGAGLTLVATVGSAAAAPVQCQGQEATLVATADREDLQGTDGVDVIHTLGFDLVSVEAKGGNDVICSYSGSTAFLYGEEGDDSIEVIDNGADDGRGPYLYDGPGADHYRGTPATHLSYRDAPGGVSIDLGAGTVVSGADTDTLVGITSTAGSWYRDTFVGSPGADSYHSQRGHATSGDQIRTGDGDDTVVAYFGSARLGDGDDKAFVWGATVAGEAGDDDIVVDMAGTVLGGLGDDTLVGTAFVRDEEVPLGAFRFSGGPGNDVLSPPFAIDEGPVDCPEACARGRLEGGTGMDTLDLNYKRSVVDLLSGRVRVLGGISRIGFFERVQGSRYADVIRGDAHPNHFRGLGRDDVLVGRGGVDVLLGGKGRDRADGGAGADQCRAERQTSC